MGTPGAGEGTGVLGELWDFEAFGSLDGDMWNVLLAYTIFVVGYIALRRHLSAWEEESLFDRLLVRFFRGDRSLSGMCRNGTLDRKPLWQLAWREARSISRSRCEFSACDLFAEGVDLDALPACRGEPSRHAAVPRGLGDLVRRSDSDLTPFERQVVELRCFSQESYARIGQEIGRSAEACRKALTRARTKLRRFSDSFFDRSNEGNHK